METNFTAKDICRILDKCKDAGVINIELGNIKVSFKEKQQGEEIKPDLEIIQNDSANQSDENQQDKVFQNEEDDQMQLMMEDPMAFEQGIVDSHLSNRTESYAGTEDIGSERAVSQV